MLRPRTTATILALTVLVTGAFACGADDENSMRGGKGGGANGESGTNGGDASANATREEQLFRGLQGDLEKKCGGTCHVDGTYKPVPPAFLAGPDAYKSIKAAPGIVTKDTYQSALLTKGAHAGPAINTDPDFEKRVVEWLDAALLGGILQLSNMKVVAPAGPDVHVLKPKFIKILATANASGDTEVNDPADTFSNTDQTIANGQEAVLGPGTALFTSPSWSPFNLATDKIRIELEKLEPGKVQVVTPPAVCKNVAQFTANVLPAMRGQAGGFNLTCSNCHGNGLANLSLNSGDQALVCNQVLAKLNQANIGQSLIVTKVTTGPHQGGTITDAAGWRALFVNNAAVFF